MAVIGSTHGREYITTQLIMKQLDYYLNSPYDSYNGSYIGRLLDTMCIYFIPMLNSDGVMLSQAGLSSVDDEKVKDELLKMNSGSYDFTSWKANARGIDINRNFDTRWEKNKNLPFLILQQL